MSARSWLIGVGLFLTLLLIPPLPGYWLRELGSTPWLPLSQGPLWGVLVDPLRFLGSLMAWGCTLSMSWRLTSRPSFLAYVSIFIAGGILYAIPHWVALLGADPAWEQALWALAIAGVAEWASMHAPLAGMLCVAAAYLVRPKPVPEPRTAIHKLLDRIGIRPPGQ